MHLLGMTPDQFSAAATAWIGAVVTVLTVLLTAACGLWYKFGPQIKQAFSDITHLKSQAVVNKTNIEAINAAAPQPVPLVAPALPAMPPLAPIIPSQNSPSAATSPKV